MQPQHFRAPAKINLHLRILGRRADGLHEIETVFQKIGLFDELEISLSREDELRIAHSPWPLGPTEMNLAWRALKLLRATGAQFPPVRLTLWKHIPPGSGLGGGSSDAAAVLKALNSVFSLRLGDSELMQLGLQLGADVPFLVSPHACCMATGVGELLTPIEHHNDWQFVILYPPVASSTALAYQLFDEQGAPPKKASSADPLIHALTSGDWGLFRTAVHNDFERVLYSAYPVLRDAAESLRKDRFDPVWPTGSGSAIVGGIEPGSIFSLPTRLPGSTVQCARLLRSPA